MNTENIKVVFVTDQNYFIPMLATINSICSQTKSKLDIRIFTTFKFRDIEIKYINLLKEKHEDISLELVQFNDESIESLEAKNHVSKAAFVKVLLPQLLSDWMRCIYLDGDLLFLEDINTLWEQFETTKTISAVRTANYYQDNKILELGPMDFTFNSGVMLLNLDKMRKSNSKDKLLDFLYKNNDKTLLNDQAAFNYVFKEDWNNLDIKWNVYVQNFIFGPKQLRMTRDELKDSRKTPHVVHFNGASKPWQKYCAHPYKKKYLIYYNDLFGKNALLVSNKGKMSFLKDKYSFFRGIIGLYIPIK